jgi:sigma-B regulation protein RsbU (phosphoserine phosphatase)
MSNHNFDYYGESQPVSASGTDFYDFISLDHGGLGISMGEVSGEKIPASLAMAGIRALLREARRKSIPGLVDELNRLVWGLCTDDLLATLFYGHIDPVRHTFHYVNAGHEPALFVQRGGETVHRLEMSGTMLGLSYRSTFRENRISWAPGDALVVVSEGIEAPAERVRQIAQEWPEATACHLVSEIMRSRAPRGDRTVVAVRFPETATGVRVSLRCRLPLGKAISACAGSHCG